ncbi:MAG: FmdB family zinc ribbon protein [Gammaproteobacteria bacterium]
MPIYEYQCEKCGHEMEKLQKMSDDPLKVCPECDEASLRKLVSAAAFKLKGTGWYETDFKDNSSKKVDAKPGGKSTEKAADKKESTTKTESKKEVKKDKKSTSSSKSTSDK